LIQANKNPSPPVPRRDSHAPPQAFPTSRIAPLIVRKIAPRWVGEERTQRRVLEHQTVMPAGLVADDEQHAQASVWRSTRRGARY